MSWRRFLPRRSRSALVRKIGQLGSTGWHSVAAHSKRLELPCAVYWIAALGIPLRIIVRLCYSGIANFWVDGYIFFFNLAQSIAHGQGIALDGVATVFAPR